VRSSNTEPTVILYLLPLVGKTDKDLHSETISTYGQLHNTQGDKYGPVQHDKKLLQI
jgi:hypothetical protein